MQSKSREKAHEAKFRVNQEQAYESPLPVMSHRTLFSVAMNSDMCEVLSIREIHEKNIRQEFIQNWVKVMRVLQRFNVYRKPGGNIPDGLKQNFMRKVESELMV